MHITIPYSRIGSKLNPLIYSRSFVLYRSHQLFSYHRFGNIWHFLEQLQLFGIKRHGNVRQMPNRLLLPLLVSLMIEFGLMHKGLYSGEHVGPHLAIVNRVEYREVLVGS